MTASRALKPADAAALFPLGGIGTGTVSLGSRGDLVDWEIANRPNKGGWLPYTFFAIRARPQGGAPVTRVLEGRIPTPYTGESGLPFGRVGGLPRLADTTMHGEYPLAFVDFADPVLPVDVRLEAFTPLVPLDVDASGIPGAVLRYRVTNPGTEPVAVTIAGSMSTPVGLTGVHVFGGARYEGRPTIEARAADGLTGLCFGTDLPIDHVRYGSATLVTTDQNTTITPQWAADFWQDGVQLFWDDLSDDGLLGEQPHTLETAPEQELPKVRTGSVGAVADLAPGESHDFEFILSWHSPNRPRAWFGNCGLPNTHGDEVVRNHYATLWTDAWAVAAHLRDNLPSLETATRDFHASLWKSTLPAEAVDAAASMIATLRSTTCFLLDDGTPDGLFAAWEGSMDTFGSCEGTCTHVWNYAQTVAHLFPALERSARRTEFGFETLPDGRMRFRNNHVFGNDPHEFHPAVDGQLGTVVRLFREWRFSGDDAFLSELWPACKRAVDYAFNYWDSNGDLVLDSQQHNTYDIEFYGENSLGGSFFYAALRAAAQMAEAVGDVETAKRYAEAAETGAARMDEMLFNGEFYIQRTDDVDAHRYQYGIGCLSDQLLGQTVAHLTGLGHLLPAEHVKSAAQAIFKYNFRTEFSDYSSVQRTYALNDESGLILCSWPNGGRPRIPFVYSDEVWTGIEYQVATHLIYEGLVDEGLAIVRAVRNRYDGRRRSPWNEVECGNHYARSMASWGVLLALTGAQWDARDRSLHFAPVVAASADRVVTVPFTTATGWGTLHVDGSGAALHLLGGSLAVDTVEVDGGTLGSFRLVAPARAAAGAVLELAAADQ
ncbi:GH116 family glycosyl-hydrolase [Microlunatus sp. Gsoil 973]|uniref:GH116 family glycosyl-hydrolase n=1 Tax=Microlunatus sp. Gsoil 973 TaxID=2672569 RepID=UPI0012B4CC9B|nr:GH116 family glycosyl-hydrolase [Microlunatus sp. Gsoil 973]QGN34255.1 hypothetical protein GJV80_17105 [Microlunatus sp. Gsoil 973]